ncbi:MAG: FHA domain-containing protein [Thermoleophilia bacterium]|nr:FHA domain-containing protein [Thermoleophilia bacterium]
MTRGFAESSVGADSGRRVSIFDSVGSSPLDDRFATGFIPGCGTYFCLSCGAQVALRETDELPACESCGDSRFRRDSIFTARQDHETTTAEHPVPSEHGPPEWLAETRRSLALPGDHIAYRQDDGEVFVKRIERGWTRIGRSEVADVCLDDPTVSRRHALLIDEPGKGLRVLDDRSLNGVFLNGIEVELHSLRDGDELAIGRFRLYLLRS